MQVSSKKYKVDWILLLFLIGATNVKLYIKLAAVLIYILYFLYRKYRLNSLQSVHWFYILMPLVGIIGALLHDSFSDEDYLQAYFFGSVYWLLGAIISYLIYITIKNEPWGVIHKTIKFFFLANALISLGELGRMMIDSGNIMPYWDWGPDMYYGGATGDHILGITGNISVANAMVTALGGLYFIFTKELRWALLCIAISMLCTSNVTIVFTLATLLLIVVFYKDRKSKKYALYAFILSAGMYPVLTYDNIQYFETVYNEDIKYKEYTEEELKTLHKITGKEWKPVTDYEITAQIFKKNNSNYYKVILSDTFQVSLKNELQYLKLYNRLKPDKKTSLYPSDDIKKIIEKWYTLKHEEMPLVTYHNPIKIYTFNQTVNYLLSSPRNVIAGAGTGNFSSKQAIKTTGLGFQGDYPVQDLYASRSFMEYHMYTLLYVLALPASEHSIINMPNSIFNQIAGEYGIIGISLFMLLYVGYFLNNRKKIDGGWYIFFFVLLCLGFEYWFEMMSLTVILELIIFNMINGIDRNDVSQQ